MCDVYGDGPPCDVWAKTTPKARKDHRCIQCDRAIVRGERYIRIGALADGTWWTYRVHPACDALVRHIAFQVCGQQVYTLDGGLTLRENVREHMGEAPEVLRMYRDHLRDRNRMEAAA